MEEVVLCRLEPAVFPIGQAKEFERIVVQPFPDISVMSITDLYVPIGRLVACGGRAIGQALGGDADTDELAGVVLTVVQPGFPPGSFAAFHPGKQEPAADPIEEKK
jgi:hypothetical protein